ncbi:unnamed protein product [Mesocestoides corti]|uniref:IFRD domain-containing protein n=1 Tax=Mesocestoides corti TaxID=53468 RepID=A0A0R3UQB3_MESCO|nr:unnamed protein product [Mesocestoides corti]
MATDGLYEKRPETRSAAIKSLQKAFRVHYLMVDDCWNYYDTLISGLESCMKRGKPTEQALSAECLSVFAAQLSPFEIRGLVSRFQPLMETRISDPVENCAFRGACALSLAWLMFLGNIDDYVSMKALMKSLESVFKMSCLKGDGKPPVHSPAVLAMHCDCIQAWCLLFSALPTFEADTVGQAILVTLVSLLESNSVDVRLAAGNAAGLIFERIRYEVNEKFKGPYFTNLIELLDQLANESNKSKSKNDLKKQRQTFRDLAAFLKTHEVPFEQVIKIQSERLQIESFCQSFHYDSLCRLLSVGMNTHLQENELTRTILGMGPPPPKVVANQARRTQDKAARHYANQFAFKMRTQHLNVSRDKRNVVAGDESN